MMRQNDIDKAQLSQNEVKLLNTLRQLWVEHVLWTRELILSTALNLSDLSFVTQRLLRNPADFANIIRPLYGDQAAKELENLMTGHLLIVIELVNAAKAGDRAAVQEQREKWYANADATAGFLSAINPHWDKAFWQQLLYVHLNRTEYEIMQLVAGQYGSSIVQYDGTQDEALLMADTMAYGIMQQFPTNVPAAYRKPPGAQTQQSAAEPVMAMQPLQFNEMFIYPQNLDGALALMQQAVAGEYGDRMLYAYLIENAPSEEEKQLIAGMRDNEIDHFNLFRQLYYQISGKVIPQEHGGEFIPPATYCDGLKTALLGEQSSMQKYRKILYAMQPGIQTNVLTEIITDEIRHGNLFSYLYAKNGCIV